MNIEIVRADASHIDDIFAIESASFTDPWSKRGLTDSLDCGMGIFLVALCDGKAAGYIIGISDDYSGYIEKLAAAPHMRRCGIGGKLIEAFEQATGTECERISLEVRSSNDTAISFYEKTGFISVGERKDFYSSPCENAIVMMKGKFV